MKVVVVGGGPAGISAASVARGYNAKAEITVYSEARHVAYSPCAIPFVLGKDIRSFSDIIMRTPVFYEKYRKIKIETGTRVISIDVGNRAIKTASKEEKYDGLVIATGSHFLIPKVDGSNLRNIFTIKNIDDGMKVENAILKARSVVVYGAKALGAEIAVALRKRKLKVTMIDENPQIFYGALDPEIASLVQKTLENKNIEIILNTRIECFSGKNEHVRKVITSKGDVDSDIVILATKTMPNADLATKAGIKINKETGAICVDEFLQTDTENVFAAGDCAETTNMITRTKSHGKLGSTAVYMGKVAGINAAGGKTRFFQVLTPWIVPLDGLAVAAVGCTVTDAQNAGYKPIIAYIKTNTWARYYPSSPSISIMLVVDEKTRRILGAQVLGKEGIRERIDFVAFMIRAEAALEDLLRMENCYAPPVASLIDPMVQAAQKIVENY